MKVEMKGLDVVKGLGEPAYDECPTECANKGSGAIIVVGFVTIRISTLSSGEPHRADVIIDQAGPLVVYAQPCAWAEATILGGQGTVKIVAGGRLPWRRLAVDGLKMARKAWKS